MTLDQAILKRRSIRSYDMEAAQALCEISENIIKR